MLKVDTLKIVECKCGDVKLLKSVDVQLYEKRLIVVFVEILIGGSSGARKHSRIIPPVTTFTSQGTSNA